MVDYIVGKSAGGKDKFQLKLNEPELQAWKSAAQSSIGTDEMFHIITTFGYDNECGKKTAFKAAASVFIHAPGNDEKLYDVQFEKILPSCKSGPYGLFITEPLKRYGAWYVEAFPRWQTR